MSDSIKFRRDLHSLAELSGQEIQTTEFIFNDLSKLEGLKIQKLNKHGLIASIGKTGGTLIRGDIDALPISEVHLDLNYLSKDSGVAHKCGHDGHSAILRETIHSLDFQELKDEVHFLFQPSEENGKGAPSVINDELFKEVNPSRAFGLHNIPGYELGAVLWKKGVITAAVATLVLKFKGISAHASSPWKGISPLPSLISLLDNAVKMNSGDNGNLLVTPVFMQLGTESNGISPGDAQLNLTIRSYSNNTLQSALDKLIEFSREESTRTNIKIERIIEDRFDACVNDDTCCDALLRAANSMGMKTIELEQPFAFGEDFGAFSKIMPVCFIGIGAGLEQAPLHHPDYDFPDELIQPAAQLWKQLLNQ